MVKISDDWPVFLNCCIVELMSKNQISKSHSLSTIIDKSEPTIWTVLSFFFLWDEWDDIVIFSNKASPSQPFEVKINEWNTCFFILWFMILWFLLRIHLVYSALCIHLAFQDSFAPKTFLVSPTSICHLPPLFGPYLQSWHMMMELLLIHRRFCHLAGSSGCC